MEAIIVAALVLAGPILLSFLNGRQHRLEKLEDWKRQDKVAERAAEVAAQLLVNQQKMAEKTSEAAELLLENNKVVAESAENMKSEIQVIHTLVNSNMTAALQGELDMARANLATLRELIGVRVSQGNEPSEGTIATLQTLEAKVKKLSANLKDRLEQTKIADAQIFIAKEKVKGKD